MATVQTFKDLQDKVLRYLDEAGDTNSTLALVKDALGTAQRLRVSQEPWPFMLWDSPVTLTTEVGRTLYTLHPEYLRPLYVYNRTQDRYLRQITESTVKPTGAVQGQLASDSADRFALWSRSPVERQPAAASQITVASSNALDSGAQSVVIRGMTATGVTTETIPAGTTGTVSFTQLLKVTKVGTWLGDLTLTDASATVLLTLFAAEAGRTHQQLRLFTIPSAAESLEYLFYRQPSPLVLDEDLPDIPAPFEDLLVYDALLYFASYNEYDGQTVNLWVKKQGEFLLALQQAYRDDQNLGAETNYITYVER